MFLIRLTIIALTLFALFGCGSGLGLPTGSTGDTARGEADAINPARNVYVVCEKDKNANTATVSTTITNNCSKNNPVTSGESEATE